MEDHLSYQKENRVANRIENLVEKQDIMQEKGELVQENRGESSGFVTNGKPPPGNQSPPKSPQDRISLKEIKSVENIFQKQKLDHSQGCQPPVSPRAVHPGSSKLKLSLPSESPGPDVDPQLQLLDTQLRHILKSPREDDSQESESSSDKCKKDLGAKIQRLDVESEGACGPAQGAQIATWASQGGMSPRRQQEEAAATKISVHMERVSRDGEEEEDILIVELPEQAQEDNRANLLEPQLEQRARNPNVMFGVVEEISQTNLYFEDLPTTNVYMDDNATRAAPYTLASQMNASLVSSEEEDNTEEEHIAKPGSLYRPHSMTSLTQSPYSEPKRRTLQLVKHLQDANEKLTEKLSWRRELAQDYGHEYLPDLSLCKDTDRTDPGPSSGRRSSKERALPPKATRPVEESGVSEPRLLYSPQQHKSVKATLLDDIPKPKFSTRSPSSPAKLANLPKESSPVKVQRLVLQELPLPAPSPTTPINWEDKQQAGKTTPKLPDQPWKLYDFGSDIPQNGSASPHIVVKETLDRDTDTREANQSGNDVDNEESDGSDTEIQPYHLDKDAVQQKLTALKLEMRGAADGASPRQVLGDEDSNGVVNALHLQNGMENTVGKKGPGEALEQDKVTDFVDTVVPDLVAASDQAVLEPQHVFRTRMVPELTSLPHRLDPQNKPDGTSESCSKPIVEKAFVRTKVVEFEIITNAHSAINSPKGLHRSHPRDLDSDWDSSSRSSRSLSSGAKAALSKLGEEASAVVSHGHVSRAAQSLCTGGRQGEEMATLGASVDVTMLDTMPSSPDVHPKPPPGQAPRKAVASTAARYAHFRSCVLVP